MAAQLAGLARFADDRAGMWPDLARAPVLPKGDDGHPAQAAAEAALEGRMAIVEAIASFRSRMQRLVEGPAQGNDLSSPLTVRLTCDALEAARQRLGIEGDREGWPEEFNDPAISRQVLGLDEE